ncbi:enoyl-CoA delta isomerase 2, peroxisomal [Ziziphus jujuba]|uniref:Enoyl-CoA delta isomerase 2, peroxisomal n=1 Tax=Ziziphus jujuba TaxID=326968 RepID=A0ABM4A3C3_ZIZJJ|nr:enoyl-CoA delta isomerase 2, peroxisomal [Ziziphus jujuba]
MCTLEKRGNLFFLTLTGDDDHRLSPAVIDSLISSLSQVASQATRGSALITTAQGNRFFSNGFDLAWAQSAGSKSVAADRLNQMVVSFKPVVGALLSLPMPTIAALPGHAAAGGFLFALCHDYILMRSDRGVLYMSEVDLGLPFPDYFTVAMRSKIGSVSARRDVMLRGMKIKGEEAVRMGIVDSAHDSAESTVEAAVRLGEKLASRKWDGEVYAEIRKGLYPELCGVLGLAAKVITPNL